MKISSVKLATHILVAYQLEKGPWSTTTKYDLLPNFSLLQDLTCQIAYAPKNSLNVQLILHLQGQIDL